jgi:4-amino-4-deoxy-L-arabinose transferase-like glycosyltransferase
VKKAALDTSAGLSPPARAYSIRPRISLEALRVTPVALALGAIVLVGLTLRLVWVLYVDTVPLGGDPRWYYVVGVNIAQGHGFVTARDEFYLEAPGPGLVTAFWPPAYSFLLAAIFKTFGVSVTAAKVVNALLGAATIPFVYALGRQLFSRNVGLGAAAIFAVFPNAIAWTPLLFAEELFVLLFVAALWVIVAFPLGARRDWVPLVALGALTGLSLLTRGQGAVLVPVAALFWLGRFGWRPAARATAISIVAAVAVITPWTVRNAIELDAFVPISTNSGAALRAGHAPDATGTTHWPRDRVDGFYMWQSLYRPDWEVKGYREYTSRAIDYALTHPRHELELTALKVYHLYRSDAGVVYWLSTIGATPLEPDGLDDALWRLFDYSYYVLFYGAVLSVPLWLRRNPNALLLANVVAMWTLFHILFLGEPRYHVPLYPLFAIAVAAGIMSAASSARQAFERRTAKHA